MGFVLENSTVSNIFLIHDTPPWQIRPESAWRLIRDYFLTHYLFLARELWYLHHDGHPKCIAEPITDDHRCHGSVAYSGDLDKTTTAKRRVQTAHLPHHR